MSIKSQIKTWWKTSTPNEKISTIFKGITAGAAIVGGFACWNESRKCRKQLEEAVGEIGDGVNVEVSDEFIRQVTGDRIREISTAQIRKTVNTAMNANWREIQQETRDQVTRAVRDNYNRITDEVAGRISKECDTLYRSELVKDIRDKASEKLTDKLDSKLDEITDEYTKNLNNMGKVYEALAGKISKKE